tara:strand:- start:369 stop:1637 length:1269 start_codon:yes stop_codon:yes gene_type:complete
VLTLTAGTLYYAHKISIEFTAEIAFLGLTLAAIGFGCSFLSKFIRDQIILSLIAIMITLFAADYWISLDRSETARSVDAREGKYAAYNRLKSEGVDVMPTTPPFQLLHDEQISSWTKDLGFVPLGYHSHKLLLSCDEGSGYITYTSDRHGFRNLDHKWDKAKPDVLYIGDSFTEGDCVQNDDTFTSVIERQLPITTINLGIGGDGPLLALAKLREYGQLLKPRKVVWVFYEGNDLAGLKVESQNQMLMKYISPDYIVGLATQQEQIDLKLAALVTSAENLLKTARPQKVVKSSFKDLILFRNLRTKLGIKFGNIAEYDFELFERILSQMQHETQSWGGGFAVVYLPDIRRYIPDEETPYSHQIRQEVMASLRKLKIPTLDLQPYLDAEDDIKDRIRGHFDEQGYHLIGTIIANWLKNELHVN